MSQNVLIIGQSGTGKSRAIKNLPADETFVINVMDKPLPFKGFNKNYQRLTSDGLTGNYYNSTDSQAIFRHK